MASLSLKHIYKRYPGGVEAGPGNDPGASEEPGGRGISRIPGSPGLAEPINGNVQNSCHCEPVRRLVWQSPRDSGFSTRFPRQCAHWLGMTEWNEKG